MMLGAFRNHPRILLAFALCLTFPLLRAAFTKSVTRENALMIEQCQRMHLPTPRVHDIPENTAEELQLMKMLEDYFKTDFLGTSLKPVTVLSPEEEQNRYKPEFRKDLNDFRKHDFVFYNMDNFHGILLEKVSPSEFFENLHQATLTEPFNWNFSNDSQGPFEAILFEAISDNAVFLQSKGDYQTAADHLIDLLRFERLFAPEIPPQDIGITSRIATCNAINEFIVNLKPDEFESLRPKIHILLDELLKDVENVNIHNQIYPFVDLYSDFRNYNPGWLIQPLTMKMTNREMRALIDYKTKLSTTGFFGHTLGQVNMLRQWEYPRHVMMHLPKYHYYLTLVNATAANIACQFHRHDLGFFPDSLSKLVPIYLPQIPLDYARTPTPIQIVVLKKPFKPDRPMLTINSDFWILDLLTDDQSEGDQLFRYPPSPWIDLTPQVQRH